MDYLKAKKEVQAMKKKENFMVVRISYDNVWVLPHKEGMALIEALKTAERFDKDYEAQRIIPLNQDNLRINLLSAEEYERYKIAALLNITPDEVKEYETPQPA